MKLIHVIEATATGTLSMAALLANSQTKQGHTVSVIFSVRPETPPNFREYFESEIDLIQVQMNSPREKLTCLPQIRKTLRSLSPQCVFMHSSFAGFLGRLATLATLKNTKFFYLPHCISFMRKDIGIIKKLIFISFEWAGSLKRSNYVACSKSEQYAIQSAIPFRECHLIENALDFTSIPEIIKSPLSCKRTVITVGQIRPQKCPEKFAAIAAAVRAHNPTIQFLWVGDGDPALRQVLESAGVHISGWAPKEQVWKFLSEASLFLSTAAWEGMPVSILEAMAVGVPVIVSDCAGNIDVVDHGKTGWIYRSNEEAVSLVLQAFRQANITEKVSENALHVAKQRFSLNRYLNEMEALISK